MKNQDEIMKRIEAAEKELAAAKEQLEKLGKSGYEKPDAGDAYYTIRTDAGVRYYFNQVDTSGVCVYGYTWENDDTDNTLFNYGNYFTSEADAQRVAVMLRYFFLLQKKAREMNGLIGYGHDTRGSDAYVLYYGNRYFAAGEVAHLLDSAPLQPMLTKECAETLVNDPEIIAAAKKAWGVEE